MPIVVSNGIRIHYEERGNGDPLILIMGLGAPGSRWEDHAATYEKYFRPPRETRHGIAITV